MQPKNIYVSCFVPAKYFNRAKRKYLAHHPNEHRATTTDIVQAALEHYTEGVTWQKKK